MNMPKNWRERSKKRIRPGSWSGRDATGTYWFGDQQGWVKRVLLESGGVAYIWVAHTDHGSRRGFEWWLKDAMDLVENACCEVK